MDWMDLNAETVKLTPGAVVDMALRAELEAAGCRAEPRFDPWAHLRCDAVDFLRPHPVITDDEWDRRQRATRENLARVMGLATWDDRGEHALSLRARPYGA